MLKKSCTTNITLYCPILILLVRLGPTEGVWRCVTAGYFRIRSVLVSSEYVWIRTLMIFRVSTGFFNVFFPATTILLCRSRLLESSDLHGRLLGRYFYKLLGLQDCSAETEGQRQQCALLTACCRWM